MPVMRVIDVYNNCIQSTNLITSSLSFHVATGRQSLETLPAQMYINEVERAVYYGGGVKEPRERAG